MKKRELFTLLDGAVATALLGKAVLAADLLIFEVISAHPGFDQRTGQPIVTIRLKNQRPFTKLESEKQVFRTAELRVDGTVILKGVIREPLLSGALPISVTIDEMQKLQARIASAAAAGSRLELAIVD